MTANNITLEQFNAFRAVQFSGSFNMMSSQARIVSGLPKDIYMMIIQNYEELQERYGEYNENE
jgi:hypothetical protein